MKNILSRKDISVTKRHPSELKLSEIPVEVRGVLDRMKFLASTLTVHEESISIYAVGRRREELNLSGKVIEYLNELATDETFTSLEFNIPRQ